MKKLFAALFALTFAAGVFAADAPATDASAPVKATKKHHKSMKKEAPKAEASTPADATTPAK